MDKVEKIVKRECPYCNKTFDVKDGVSREFEEHLFDEHYESIVSDFDIYDLVMDDNQGDIMGDYMTEIKDMLYDNYEDEIVDDWGEDYVTDIIEELVADAKEIKE